MTPVAIKTFTRYILYILTEETLQVEEGSLCEVSALLLYEKYMTVAFYIYYFDELVWGNR